MPKSKNIQARESKWQILFISSGQVQWHCVLIFILDNISLLSGYFNIFLAFLFLSVFSSAPEYITVFIKSWAPG